MNAIAKNITTYRERMGWSKKKLAEKIECDPSLITLYENGDRNPTVKTLVKLADLFGISISDFTKAEPLPEIQVAARKTGPVAQEDLSIFYKLARNYIKVLEKSGYSSKYTGPTFNIESGIENYASEIKRMLKLSELFTLEQLITALSSVFNLPVFRIPFANPKVSGLSIKIDKTAVIFVNSGHCEERQLFSLCHELAHILFHLSENSWITSVASSRDPLEKEAGAFAQNILVKNDNLKQDISKDLLHTYKAEYIKHMANKFRVSPECMFKCFSDLGLVEYKWTSYKVGTTFNDNYSREIDFSTFPVKFNYLVYKLFKDAVISTGKAAEYLMTDVRNIINLTKEENE